MQLLQHDQSLVGSIHFSHGSKGEAFFDGCTVYAQVGDSSMLPSCEPGTYLFGVWIDPEQMEIGKNYVFGVGPKPQRIYVFRRFDGLVGDQILISATNPDAEPCQPIEVANLLDVIQIKWTFVKEAYE